MTVFWVEVRFSRGAHTASTIAPVTLRNSALNTTRTAMRMLTLDY